MDLQDSQPTFKFIVSPYDTNNVQDIEKLIREKLGWSVQKSVMQHYKISVPTEWIIIPPEQSKYLYDKVLGMKQSQNIHMLDTRVLDGLPKLNDNEKVSEFKWKNKNINENVIFKPFDKIIPSSRIHETDDLSNSSTSVDGIHLNVLNISSPPVSKQSKANKPSANANETIKKPSDQKQKQQKIM
ncbi:unnamed protein product [Rotaria sp. Silwood2]|nr:unnamed protein product [Rotaria sp. Silwood2]